jgi:hypothetical protein
VMQRFECVKNLGEFSCTSQRNDNIWNMF